MASLNGIVSFIQQPRIFYRLGIKGLKSSGHLYFSPMAAAPTAAAAEGRVYWATGVGLVQDLGAGFSAASALGGVVVSKQWVATSVDENIFVADRPYKVVGFKAVPTIAGTDAGAVSLDIKKCTGTQAPSAGTTVLLATVDLKGTINTVVTPGLSATGSVLLLAAGDRLAADFTGVLTAAIGNYEVVLIPQ